MAGVRAHNLDTPRSFWAPFMIGIGVMAGVDEIVFHQLLAWHHFYDLATLRIGLLADGLLHAGEMILIVAGFFMLLALRRRQALATDYAWAGFFMGAGAFQVWDGVIDHKVLRTHQIRYNVDILPYDIAWNLFGLVLLGVGFAVLLRARSRQRRPLQRGGILARLRRS